MGKEKARSKKRPFDIDIAVERLREAVEPFAKAAMFELAEEGYTSAFEQLVACIISIRTYDETMLPVARDLFGLGEEPARDLTAADVALDAGGVALGTLLRRLDHQRRKN